ncbi:MAG TPA: methionyl-tRNA formyltransferase [Solirubrobacteraceae bacterium]|nr:methionyl-tRNA formyltransferase [Solirubrobacteraceae bacterium]
MRTVFIGTSDFAAAVLERLARSDAHRPALVLTRPDRPRGRGRRLSSPPVAELARALRLPLEQPASVNEPHARAAIDRALGVTREAQRGLRGEHAPHAAAGEPGQEVHVQDERAQEEARGHDEPAAGERAHDERAGVVVVCAFGALIKEPLLSEHELLNVHPSLLPRWRGAAPVERAIMAGDERTGVSIMRLTAGLDSGPLCLAADEPIHAHDTYGSLAERLQAVAAELLVRALEQRPAFVEQPTEGVTYAEKLGPADRLLDPARPAVELERVVRALHPHIGARVQLPGGEMLGVHRAALLDAREHQPRAQPATPEAALDAHDGRLLLHCTPGMLELLVVQPAGGRAMDAADYLRGRR